MEPPIVLSIHLEEKFVLLNIVMSGNGMDKSFMGTHLVTKVCLSSCAAVHKVDKVWSRPPNWAVLQEGTLSDVVESCSFVLP